MLHHVVIATNSTNLLNHKINIFKFLSLETNSEKAEHIYNCERSTNVHIFDSNFEVQVQHGIICLKKDK